MERSGRRRRWVKCMVGRGGGWWERWKPKVVSVVVKGVFGN